MTGSSLILLCQPSFAKEGLRSFRPDLQKKISFFCSNQNLSNSSDLLKHEIFDSQSLVYKFPKKVLRKDYLNKLLDKKSHDGFYGHAFVSCEDENTILFVTRSPSSLEIKDSNVTVPRSIQDLCSEIDLRYIDSLHGLSQKLMFRKKLKLPLGNGVFSLSCLPKEHVLWGFETWFLIPVGKGAEDKVPEFQFQKTEDNSKERMQGWLNMIRKREGRSSVDFNNSVLREVAQNFGVKGSIEHEKSMKVRMQKLALHSELRLVGENRVQGRSLHELAWLLWNSPRHRDLLLSQVSTSVGTYLSFKDQTWFLVWVFAEKKGNEGV